MKTACKSALLSFIIYVNVSFCYPVKPLNERSTELAWQAWLLVDQSNNRQNDMGFLRKKITPKSIFVVPDFNKTTLPPCGDGYQSDGRGECIKISIINSTLQDVFIKNHYLSQFSVDYEDVEVDEPQTQTQGPLQFNIPLFDDTNDEADTEESNIAIVLAPKKHFSNENTSVKVDVKRNNSDKFNVDTVAAIFGVNPDEVKMTTLADFPQTEEITTMLTTPAMKSGEDETTTSITTSFPSTTTEEISTTVPTTTEVSETTTVDDEETLVDGDAIFFRWRV